MIPPVGLTVAGECAWRVSCPPPGIALRVFMHMLARDGVHGHVPNTTNNDIFEELHECPRTLSFFYVTATVCEVAGGHAISISLMQKIQFTWDHF